MNQGTIARLTDRGFGFIKSDAFDKDVFMHAKNLSEGLAYEDLREGDAVTFDIEETDRGLNAINVARA